MGAPQITSDGGGGGAGQGASLAAAGAVGGPWAIAAVAAFQLISGYQQAEMIREQAQLKKKIDNMNADAADLDAFNAEADGYGGAARYQNVIDSTVSDQRTAYAANNVDVNYGTAAEVQTDTKITGMQNLMDIQKQARNKAYGYKQQAINIRLQGDYTVLQGNINASGAEAQGVANAINTGVTGYSRK